MVFRVQAINSRYISKNDSGQDRSLTLVSQRNCRSHVHSASIALLSAICLLLLSSLPDSKLMSGVGSAMAAEAENAKNSNTASIATQIGGISDGQSSSESDQRWNAIKPTIFGERPITASDEIVHLETPHRAFNGSRVEVTMRALIPQSEDYYIKKLYLIIDKNPLPLAGTFKFEPNKGWATIETEVRINEYSKVRVVAETSDNTLHMTDRFVKAVGGCSALPDSYDRSDANTFGRMDLTMTEPLIKSISEPSTELLNGEQPSMAKFKLIHPNASGMQYDQFTRTYIPAHYVHTIVAKFNDREIFTLDTNFSLSQDPSVSFNFVPLEDGEVTIYAIDSKNERFEQSWPIEAID